MMSAMARRAGITRSVNLRLGSTGRGRCCQALTRGASGQRTSSPASTAARYCVPEVTDGDFHIPGHDYAVVQRQGWLHRTSEQSL